MTQRGSEIGHKKMIGPGSASVGIRRNQDEFELEAVRAQLERCEGFYSGSKVRAFLMGENEDAWKVPMA